MKAPQHMLSCPSSTHSLTRLADRHPPPNLQLGTQPHCSEDGTHGFPHLPRTRVGLPRHTPPTVKPRKESRNHQASWAWGADRHLVHAQMLHAHTYCSSTCWVPKRSQQVFQSPLLFLLGSAAGGWVHRPKLFCLGLLCPKNG